MSEVIINIENNNKLRLAGDLRGRNVVFEKMKIKHPNAFFLRKELGNQWDGKIQFLSERGYAKVGMFPKIVNILEEAEIPFTIKDYREIAEAKYEIERVGDKILRGYQKQAVDSVIYNEVYSIPFNRGIINAATNAGKTLIGAALYLSYDIPTLILINDGDLFTQFKTELPEMLGDDVGFVRGKEKNFKKFTVAMVPTLYRGKPYYERELAKYRLVLVDECDLASSKSYQYCLSRCYNAQIRVGLSGSVGVHKNPIKNETIRAWFGEELFKITKKELVEKKVSAKPVIKIVKGGNGEKIPGNYPEEYRKGITENIERLNKIVKRIKYNTEQGNTPILVVGKFKDQVRIMCEFIQDSFDNLSVQYIHSGVSKTVRDKAIADFKKRNLDILVSSLIIKRGKNLPLIKTIINASGTDNQQDIIQIMGRGERFLESLKEKFYIEDFIDEGRYLKRHSKHRVIFYKKQGFKVIELYKKGN